MRHENDLTTVRKLCISLIKKGAFAQVGIALDELCEGEPRVYIEFKNKSYRLSDPDWKVVIKQLQKLKERIEHEKN